MAHRFTDHRKSAHNEVTFTLVPYYGLTTCFERAVSASTHMGGHFTQGHVDTVATILSVTPDGNSLVFHLQPRDRSVLCYIVEKGYVTLDGARVMITKVQDGENRWWVVTLISYTQEKVVTAAKEKGEDVIVEVDIVGKYVEKSITEYFYEFRC